MDRIRSSKWNLKGSTNVPGSLQPLSSSRVASSSVNNIPVPPPSIQTATQEVSDNLPDNPPTPPQNTNDTQTAAEVNNSGDVPEPAFVSYRDRQWLELLESDNDVVDLEKLKKLSWNGVPGEWRPQVWQLLLAYLPSDRKRREQTIARKRREYTDAVAQYFELDDEEYRSIGEQKMLRQILVDVPRTSPDVPLFHQASVQRCLERILYVWALRHPASGYVQGINDLATPLFVVFLSASLMPIVANKDLLSSAVESLDAQKIPEEVLAEVEADTYWCLTKLLDNIQDHYTAGQPGLQRQMYRLEELIRRTDTELHSHFTENNIEFNFTFRWMNNLLMRELPLRAIIRMWDTCLSEDRNGFEDFHVFICAAFLKHFSQDIRDQDGDTLMCYLQDLPTSDWGVSQVETVLSEAYVLAMLYKDSPNHLVQHDVVPK
mmetsp:Transcript_2914/g.4025  ORF Transcript_2914/g.4025 Transcript_2914/m.4025 type:complete len:432 (+) Transcript_2914:37-1332(+)